MEITAGSYPAIPGSTPGRGSSKRADIEQAAMVQGRARRPPEPVIRVRSPVAVSHRRARAISSAGGAPVPQAGGRGFEALIAHSADRVVAATGGSQEVGGSKPSSPTPSYPEEGDSRAEPEAASGRACPTSPTDTRPRRLMDRGHLATNQETGGSSPPGVAAAAGRSASRTVS